MTMTGFVFALGIDSWLSRGETSHTSSKHKLTIFGMTILGKYEKTGQFLH